jgi:hypothetical protein
MAMPETIPKHGLVSDCANAACGLRFSPWGEISLTALDGLVLYNMHAIWQIAAYLRQTTLDSQ